MKLPQTIAVVVALAVTILSYKPANCECLIFVLSLDITRIMGSLHRKEYYYRQLVRITASK